MTLRALCAQERMEALRAQHRDWQRATESLMATLRREPRGAVQPPQVQGDAPEVLEMELSQEPVSPRSSEDSSPRKSSKAKKTTLKRLEGHGERCF